MDTDRLIAQLDLHEGRRRKPYTDTVGKLTIGVGHNLSDRGLSDRVIDIILHEDIEDHWYELVTALPWVKGLDDVRQRVLLDMAFNLGIPKLLGFKNTLAAVERGDYEAAKAGMLNSKWATQVGHRAIRLAEMMESGIDSQDF